MYALFQRGVKEDVCSLQKRGDEDMSSFYEGLTSKTLIEKGSHLHVTYNKAVDLYLPLI